MFEIDPIIELLNKNEIRTYMATPEREDIRLEDNNDSSDLDKLIDLMKSLDVKIAFIYAHYLSEEEILANLISEDDYSSTYEDLFKKHVKDHNKKMHTLKTYIDKETQISIFFVSQGVIYSLLLTNEELEYQIKGDFISELKDQYEEQIDNMQNEKHEQFVKERAAFVEKLKIHLKTDEDFKKCTNKTMRRSYYYGVLSGREDLDLKCPIRMRMVDIDEVIEQVWTEVKLALKSH